MLADEDLNARLSNSQCITAWATLCARDDILGDWMQEKVRSEPDLPQTLYIPMSYSSLFLNPHPDRYPPFTLSPQPRTTLITIGSEPGLPAVQPSAGLGTRRKRGGWYAELMVW